MNDVLAEIRFDHLHAGSFERRVQVDLLGRHTLAFDDDARAVFGCKFANDRVCFCGVVRPVNLRAAILGIANKLFQVAIEVRQRFVFDRAGLCSQRFPVRQTRRSLFTSFAEKRCRVLQRAAQVRIGQRRLRILPKFFAG